MGRMQDKVAIVTGAARGTGAAIARLFVAEGATVVLADVSDDAGEAMAAEIGAGAHYRHLDVGEASDWDTVVAATLQEHRRIDVLVNNAAILKIASIADTTPDDFMRLVRVNQLGPFLGIRAVSGPMREAGGGAIVNVASSDGVKGMNGVAAYASTKWALRGITKATAMELAKHRIRVNAVCPEAGSAELSAPFLQEGIDPVMASEYNLKKLLAPPEHYRLPDFIGDVARTVLFLASDDCPTATAADFIVDGGLTAGYIQPGIPGGE
jgi:3alpha(or 20beta)-hydroxysteroid dehydrogenase